MHFIFKEFEKVLNLKLFYQHIFYRAVSVVLVQKRTCTYRIKNFIFKFMFFRFIWSYSALLLIQTPIKLSHNSDDPL